MSQYNPDALLLLCELLLPHDQSFVKDVSFSITNASLYLKNFSVNRGVHDPIPELPWIALVEGLIDREYVIEIDWATAAEDVADGIASLLSKHSYELHTWTLKIVEEWKDADTDIFLQVIGRRLEEHNLILAYIDIHSDSYPLIIVKRAHITKIQTLAQKAGYGKIINVSELLS